jgi:hypothetical protein
VSGFKFWVPKHAHFIRKEFLRAPQIYFADSGDVPAEGPGTTADLDDLGDEGNTKEIFLDAVVKVGHPPPLPRPCSPGGAESQLTAVEFR